MGTRAWLVALLVLTLACEGSEIGEARGEVPGIGTNAGTGGNTGAGAGTDAGADADTDTGADADAGTDAGGVGGSGGGGGGSGGGGGDPDPCAGGPLPAPIPNCNPTPSPDTGDIHADCVARINQFRWDCQCLPPLPRWTDGEACADSNAQYDSTNGVHASFYAMPCGSGARAQNECPGWPSNDHVITGCLKSMWDEGPEDGNPDTVNGHYESMATTTYTRVACGFYTTPSGQVWGVQNFD